MARFCSNLLSCSVGPLSTPCVSNRVVGPHATAARKRPRYQSDAVRRAPGGKRARLSHLEPLANHHHRRVSVHCSVHLELAPFPTTIAEVSFLSRHLQLHRPVFRKETIGDFQVSAVHKRELCAFQTLGARPVCAVAKGWAKA
jgi:hypothetical protein